jgi:acetylornithine/succinyldiaminopimelate/putrescine aminotransferase
MSDQTTEQATTAGDQPVAQTTSLQLSDILLTAQVIQLASQRGAFRAEEFTQVGQLYDRLIAFLKESGALQKQDSATEAPAEPAPADATAA